MENQKYRLVDATTEEQENFMKKFTALCQETGLYYEPCPQYSRKEIGKPWEVTIVVLLQKKVLIEDSIPSPFTDKDEPDPTI